MGQKSNPNSFNKYKNQSSFFDSFFTMSEYSRLFFYHINFSRFIEVLLKKSNCIVKQVYFFQNYKKQLLIIYISFFFINLKSSRKRNNTEILNDFLNKKIFKILHVLGFRDMNQKLIFHNINNKSVSKKRNEFNAFKHEIYYNSGLQLLEVLKHTNNNSVVVANFIAKFFRIFHRSKKGLKFLLFLMIFSKLSIKSSNIKGIKIQIKGRFRGASRTQKRTFLFGNLPLQTIDTPISYKLVHVYTSYGAFGIKVWLNEKRKNDSSTQKTKI